MHKFSTNLPLKKKTNGSLHNKSKLTCGNISRLSRLCRFKMLVVLTALDDPLSLSTGVKACPCCSCSNRRIKRSRCVQYISHKFGFSSRSTVDTCNRSKATKYILDSCDRSKATKYISERSSSLGADAWKSPLLQIVYFPQVRESQAPQEMTLITVPLSKIVHLQQEILTPLGADIYNSPHPSIHWGISAPPVLTPTTGHNRSSQVSPLTNLVISGT